MLVQSKRIYFARYGFGDSLGGGFGPYLGDSKFGLDIHVGTWNKQVSNNSSHFRSFGNLLITMELEAN